ncbi:MAG: GNAT family N-acetyltransferase, partial [Cryomorphaceae bacterium]|nr:GNAT family N-acetyltransferase [Cryomorphaceae bacterium]
LDFAKESGFEKCYIETMPNMVNAQKLYLKKGFKYINGPLGNTCHNACPVWMLKKLR